MSDTPDKPLDPRAEGSDAAIENQVFSEEAVLDAAEEVAETKRRIWLMRMIRRERRREKAAKDRSTLINLGGLSPGELDLFPRSVKQSVMRADLGHSQLTLNDRKSRYFGL